nr:hypothetical protein KV8917_900030 [Klebsiella variicola]
MSIKFKTCSYKNTAARNARALQKAQEGPIYYLIMVLTSEEVDDDDHSHVPASLSP